MAPPMDKKKEGFRRRILEYVDLKQPMLEAYKNAVQSSKEYIIFSEFKYVYLRFLGGDKNIEFNIPSKNMKCNQDLSIIINGSDVTLELNGEKISYESAVWDKEGNVQSPDIAEMCKSDKELEELELNRGIQVYDSRFKQYYKNKKAEDCSKMAVFMLKAIFRYEEVLLEKMRISMDYGLGEATALRIFEFMESVTDEDIESFLGVKHFEVFGIKMNQFLPLLRQLKPGHLETLTYLCMAEEPVDCLELFMTEQFKNLKKFSCSMTPILWRNRLLNKLAHLVYFHVCYPLTGNDISYLREAMVKSVNFSTGRIDPVSSSDFFDICQIRRELGQEADTSHTIKYTDSIPDSNKVVEIEVTRNVCFIVMKEI